MGMDIIKLSKKSTNNYITIGIVSIIGLISIFLLDNLSDTVRKALVTICFLLILNCVNFFFKKDFIQFDETKLTIMMNNKKFQFNYKNLSYIKYYNEPDAYSYPKNYLIMVYNNLTFKIPIFAYKNFESELNTLIEKYDINERTVLIDEEN